MIDYSKLFDRQRAVPFEKDGTLLACRAVKMEDIEAFVAETCLYKPRKPADLRDRLVSLGAELVESAGDGTVWCPTAWLEEIVKDDERWFEPKPKRRTPADLASIDRKLDTIVGMLSEMYVPLVQKKALERIMDRLEVSK